MVDLKYPVGKFEMPAVVDDATRAEAIDQLAALPSRLRAALAGLDAARLDTPYRPGGWTVRQVAHHLADSHLNAYVRLRLALTEDSPAIKPYAEARWAELPDARVGDVGPSLAILDGLHERWATLLGTLRGADWARTFRHPELGVVTLDRNLQVYAWHSRHHVAHVTSLRERMGWS